MSELQSSRHCWGILLIHLSQQRKPLSASDQMRGSIGAAAGHRDIAQSGSAEIADALFRYSVPEEVMTFPSTCGTCSPYCENRMFVTRIPYFQEVFVMASTCDDCDYRNSELKPGGRVPEKGKMITLCVKNIKDSSRDVIKSDSASVEVPELDLELAVVTTVDGLITKISESVERVHGFPPFKTFSRLLAILLGGLQQNRIVCLDEFFNPVDPILSNLGHLINLKTLTLSDNNLIGPIPSGLGHLTNLTNLYLNSSQLNGSIAPEIGNEQRRRYQSHMSLSSLTQLRLLKLSLNQPSSYESDHRAEVAFVYYRNCSPISNSDSLTGIGGLNLLVETSVLIASMQML
ncbi:hypothetical protein Dsin_007443 [Dipteronia sinensis]|uniref:Zinc finger ZPR1-type domain-containing protein n=1 Tax=Dipteronia sinensis TaxID=43782 RepID=A0AAE0B0J4_9ROSI|nr:hypothetical protein Dsin_007443 [Dipteronia sinensis]